jgi:hypothetical protein
MKCHTMFNLLILFNVIGLVAFILFVILPFNLYAMIASVVFCLLAIKVEKYVQF